MDGVGSGLDDDVSHAADRMASFCTVLIGHYVELLDGFDREILHQATDDQIFVIATVHIDVQLTTVTAIDADVADSSLGGVESFSWSHPRDQGHEFGNVPIQDWKLGDFRGRN